MNTERPSSSFPMAPIVDLAGLRQLLDRGAQLLEVLPREEYDELHLPGALNIPLKELDAERAQRLDLGRPVVAYCWDALCDMSPRAAAWLQAHHYDAYDYALSKVDWMAHGLPMEGTAAARPTARSIVRDDVATCAADDHAASIIQAVDASPYAFAIVTANGIVLGRVPRSRLADAPPDASAERLMEPGPSTIRPHTELGELAQRFARSRIETLLVTTPAGELLGVVHRDDAPTP